MQHMATAEIFPFAAAFPLDFPLLRFFFLLLRFFWHSEFLHFATISFLLSIFIPQHRVSLSSLGFVRIINQRVGIFRVPSYRESCGFVVIVEWSVLVHRSSVYLFNKVSSVSLAAPILGFESVYFSFFLPFCCCWNRQPHAAFLTVCATL